jgi:hypothetical protein
VALPPCIEGSMPLHMCVGLWVEDGPAFNDVGGGGDGGDDGRRDVRRESDGDGIGGTGRGDGGVNDGVPMFSPGGGSGWGAYNFVPLCESHQVVVHSARVSGRRRRRVIVLRNSGRSSGGGGGDGGEAAGL